MEKEKSKKLRAQIAFLQDENRKLRSEIAFLKEDLDFETKDRREAEKLIYA